MMSISIEDTCIALYPGEGIRITHSHGNPLNGRLNIAAICRAVHTAVLASE